MQQTKEIVYVVYIRAKNNNKKYVAEKLVYDFCFSFVVYTYSIHFYFDNDKFKTISENRHVVLVIAVNVQVATAAKLHNE